MRPISGLLHNNSRPSLPSRRGFLLGVVATTVTARLSAQTRPKRIISTAPSITEALFALGLGDQVVGVSRFCNFPASVQKLPKVGSYIAPDAEAIARLVPDLVVLERLSSELTERLHALRINFIEVPHGTLEDVYTGITLIAKAAAVPERSIALNARLQRELSAIQGSAKRIPSSRILIVLSRRPGLLADLIAVGPGNYLQELVQMSGGSNVLAQPGLPMYPRIALETVLRDDPDVILDLSGAHDSEAERLLASAQITALWNTQPQLKAVRSGRVFAGTSNVLLVPGPRAPEAARLLFDYMHGAPDRERAV